jgi:hypothetical protein
MVPMARVALSLRMGNLPYKQLLRALKREK